LVYCWVYETSNLGCPEKQKSDAFFLGRENSIPPSKCLKSTNLANQGVPNVFAGSRKSEDLLPTLILSTRMEEILGYPLTEESYKKCHWGHISQSCIYI